MPYSDCSPDCAMRTRPAIGMRSVTSTYSGSGPATTVKTPVLQSHEADRTYTSRELPGCRTAPKTGLSPPPPPPRGAGGAGGSGAAADREAAESSAAITSSASTGVWLAGITAAAASNAAGASSTLWLNEPPELVRCSSEGESGATIPDLYAL